MVRLSLKALGVPALLVSALFLTAASPGPAPYLAVYNNFVFWGTGGSCTYQFALDGTGGDSQVTMTNLVIYLVAQDKDGSFIGNLELDVPQLGGTAERWSQQTADAPCGTSKFFIARGYAVIKGKTVDLKKIGAFARVSPMAPLEVGLLSDLPSPKSGAKQ
jgi:hypothetical protein